MVAETERSARAAQSRRIRAVPWHVGEACSTTCSSERPATAPDEVRSRDDARLGRRAARRPRPRHGRRSARRAGAHERPATVAGRSPWPRLVAGCVSTPGEPARESALTPETLALAGPMRTSRPRTPGGSNSATRSSIAWWPNRLRAIRASLRHWPACAAPGSRRSSRVPTNDPQVSLDAEATRAARQRQLHLPAAVRRSHVLGRAPWRQPQLEPRLLGPAVGADRTGAAGRAMRRASTPPATQLLISSAVTQTYVELARATALEALAVRAGEQRRRLLELTQQRVKAGLDSQRRTAQRRSQRGTGGRRSRAGVALAGVGDSRARRTDGARRRGLFAHQRADARFRARARLAAGTARRPARASAGRGRRADAHRSPRSPAAKRRTRTSTPT